MLQSLQQQQQQQQQEQQQQQIQWNSDFSNIQGNGNWFGKLGVRKIEGGIKSHLFYTVVLFYKIQEGRQQRYITLVNV